LFQPELNLAFAVEFAKCYYSDPSWSVYMSKVLKCREVGMDCDFVAHGENEEQVMSKAVEHARKDHGMDTIPAEVVTKVKAAIHDE
jgi:predicted small metal-binding protein